MVGHLLTLCACGSVEEPLFFKKFAYEEFLE